MRHHLPGNITRLTDADPGTCILFKGQDLMHAGIVVQFGDGLKQILDLTAAYPEDGPKYHLYSSSSFLNESIIALPTARIVPSLEDSAMGCGIYNGSAVSRVLYLTSDGPVVWGGAARNNYCVSLTDGSISQSDLAYQIYTARWRIEVDDGTGRYALLREFAA